MDAHTPIICADCHKEKNPTQSVSITQGLTEQEFCRCDFDEIERTICARCGLKKQTSAGSITQWIFREATCQCTRNQYVKAWDLRPIANQQSSPAQHNDQPDQSNETESRQDSIPALKSSPDADGHVCAICGLEQASNRGSVTQWVFRKATCQCGADSEQLKGIGQKPLGALSSLIESCDKCGKHRPPQALASITQWIFRADMCSCNRVSPIAKSKLCPICRRYPIESKGSITQWIVRAQGCFCSSRAELTAPDWSDSVQLASPAKASTGQLIDPSPLGSELSLDASHFPVERYSPFEELGKTVNSAVYLCN